MWYRTTNANAYVFSQDSPTVGPSKNPSRSPSKAPTDNPSKSPTQSPTPDDCVRTVVYQCREFPYEGWCKQMEPQECIDPDTCGWKAVGFVEVLEVLLRRPPGIRGPVDTTSALMLKVLRLALYQPAMVCQTVHVQDLAKPKFARRQPRLSIRFVLQRMSITTRVQPHTMPMT